MHELTFFRQARHDGGMRMGIELDGESLLLNHFEPGQEDDPLGSALLWFIDIRCRGGSMPRDAETARQWFLKHRDSLVEGLEEFAREVFAGTDDDAPLTMPKPLPPLEGEQAAGLTTEYVCSSIRRIKGPELSRAIQDVADHFSDYINLHPVSPAMR